MDENFQAEVPDLTEPLLVNFSNRYQLKSAPVHLAFTDCGYPASQCHLSAKHCALTKGGRRVHGWAVWKFQDFLLAEHHSVWDDGNRLIDVTPPKFGGDRILFIRDDVSDLIQMGDRLAMWCDRSTLNGAPFLLNYEAQPQATWGLLPDDWSCPSMWCKFGCGQRAAFSGGLWCNL